MKGNIVAVALLLLAVGVFALELTIYEPISTKVTDGQIIDLGVVGPGQTAYVVAESEIKEGGLQGKGGRLDKLVFMGGPAGWNTTDSPLYSVPMKAIIKVPSDAADGTYEFQMKAVDEGGKEQLGDVSFKARLVISKDILEMDVSPAEAKTGAGQPAGYYVTIRNTGVASDVFEVTSEGLPGWRYRQVVFVPKKSVKVVRYEVAADEEQEYRLKIRVGAPFSSELLKAEKEVGLTINTNLVSDLQATGHGLLLFPTIEQPVYSIMGLISNLFFR
ncbi:MAG: hypothetical protein ABIF01_02200 [Candidatus Micrarchaeota archaeon]